MRSRHAGLTPMPANGESMKPSLRKILADSHIAAIAIAVLLFWMLSSAFRAPWDPLSRAADFLFTAVAIGGVPYIPSKLDFADRLMLFTTVTYFFTALISFGVAWLLSRWVYRVGPFRSLSNYRTQLVRRNRV